MAAVFEGVVVSSLFENGETTRKCSVPLALGIYDEAECLILKFRNEATNGPESVFEVEMRKDDETAAVGSQSFVITKDGNSILLQFPNTRVFQTFHQVIEKFKKREKDSVFSRRTDDASALQYFQFYGYLSQQQNMMQDYIRTSTYQRAILSNVEDFKDKVVLDVGAGSGILSFFAIQAGAKKVYAVEASSMAKHAETLVYNNKVSEKIVLIPGKIEEISLPEMVDTIISEPMGYMLFNERMLETYLHAKKWLSSSGKMFPTRGVLHIAPFTDTALFMEQLNKANFWYQHSFHGVDLSSLRDTAVKEYFRQPIVDTFDIRICLAKSQSYTVDFQTATETDLHNIEIPLSFLILQCGELHGLAFWFDVAFIGSTQTVWLSTSPTQPLTHWYQVRCLVDSPLIVQRGQVVTGKVILNANARQSYDVDIELQVEGTSACSHNSLDLKNPFFRYTGQPPQPPPGFNETSPSESYWQTLDAQTATNNSNLLVNGIALMNGNTLMDMQTAQLGVHHSNLISLGSLPSPGTLNSSKTGSSRVQASVPTSSIGGGISPSLFNQTQQQVVLGNTSHFPVNNSLMIGDYVTPGNIVMPGNNRTNTSYKN
ncbi:histone-arginine methyltransferase CARMER-like isoform X2 [Tachypleus tridentatus]|uniref:histone-arginine methyltransferase CARMER-like isoform X2 n=1 Tax=Tachypleus tridentatus TaxID=6853 RepID=UPI003FD67469